MYDKNHDGRITRDELKEVIKAVGLKPDEQWISQLIAQSDRDNSGTIEWEEFLAKMTSDQNAFAPSTGGGTSDRSSTDRTRSPGSSGPPTTRLVTRRVTTVTITEQQLQELRTQFELWDKDKNGVLTENEIRDVLSSSGMQTGGDWVREFIRECDTNRDGKISWPEFLRLMTVGSPSHPGSPPTETQSRIIGYGPGQPQTGADLADSSSRSTSSVSRQTHQQQEQHPDDSGTGRMITTPPVGAESFTERHQEISEGDPNVRTERIVNPDGSITTRTITSKVRTVKQTVKTTQLLPATEAVTFEMKEEDVSALRRAFDLFDADKDERISRLEMREAIKSLGLEPTDAWIEQIFRDSDYDGSGMISWPEFLRACATGDGSPFKATISDRSVVQTSGHRSQTYNTSVGGVPIVETHSWNISYDQDGSGNFAGGRVQQKRVSLQTPTGVESAGHGEPTGSPHFVSAQAIDSGTRVVDQETYKTEKDGVVEVRTVKKVTVQSALTAGNSVDHEDALTAAILEATKVDPNVMVEKVEYQHH
jgi:Ca2+-binding EF-hand superfamily protein